MTAPMTAPVAAPVTDAAFNEAYDAHILNRAFVENRGYYHIARERYAKTFRHFERLGLGPGARTLDIGGGQFAILASKLLGHDGFAGDAVATAEADVRAAGLGFCKVDLFSDEVETDERFDCVTLLEVIEHIPQPPYIVFERIKRLLKPGGVLFLTTPNGHRFRNVMYMLAGKEILGVYRYPEPGQVLGHQHEYTLWQMEWQTKHAGMAMIFAERFSNQSSGHTLTARIARALSAPVNLAPHLRNSIVLAARTPGG